MMEKRKINSDRMEWRLQFGAVGGWGGVGVCSNKGRAEKSRRSAELTPKPWPSRGQWRRGVGTYPELKIEERGRYEWIWESWRGLLACWDSDCVLEPLSRGLLPCTMHHTPPAPQPSAAASMQSWPHWSRKISETMIFMVVSLQWNTPTMPCLLILY